MNVGGQPVPAGAARPGASHHPVPFHGLRAGLAVALAVFTYALFPASPAVEFPIYEIGSVATDNVIAPFAFHRMKSQGELAKEREAVARAAEPVYMFAPAGLDSARQQLAAFAAAIDSAERSEPRAAVQAVQRAAAAHGVSLSVPSAVYVADERRRNALIGTVARAFDRWLSAGVASTGALENVRGDVLLRAEGVTRRASSDSIATFGVLVSRARLIRPDPGSAVGDALYLRLLAAFFHPTIVLDRAATELQKEALARSVPASRFDVRAGERIVAAHEVVGREEHEKLRALHDAIDARPGARLGLRRVLGTVLFDCLIVGLLWVSLLLFRPDAYSTWRYILMFAVVGGIVLVGAAIVARARPMHPELIPVVVAVVLISALFDQRIAVITAMVLAILVGGQSVFRGTNALFINLVGGVVAAFSVRVTGRRNQAYYWIGFIALGFFVSAAAIGLTLDLPTADILASAAYGALNALISVLLALLVLPIAEHFTGIETDLTLLEWSDLNRPLMQRLSLEAPGTYAHTIAIANLAEAAARAIGANALLARVGAYHHDIGKLAKPQYFAENQAKGRNPHDKLKPGASAQIIRNHVPEGLALADEYKLPRALRAFINEHHGTGAISYFLEKARERDGPAANPSEYAYPGPLPQTVETAVVMLADGVEASARVLHEPTAGRIRDVVDHIVRQRIENGQLTEAPLTLRELDIVKEQFTRVLIAMYHNRIDYPTASGGVTSEFASV